jgi:hypothetical protein
LKQTLYFSKPGFEELLSFAIGREGVGITMVLAMKISCWIQFSLAAFQGCHQPAFIMLLYISFLGL